MVGLSKQLVSMKQLKIEIYVEVKIICYNHVFSQLQITNISVVDIFQQVA